MDVFCRSYAKNSAFRLDAIYCLDAPIYPVDKKNNISSEVNLDSLLWLIAFRA